MKEIFGIYEYQGISKINPLLNDDNSLQYTALHELMHKFLTEDTSYGDFVTHIKLISKTLKKYSHSADILQNRMIIMQECIAYFLEYMAIKRNSSSHEFKIELKKMKKDNRQNFNLMNKLDYLIDYKYKSDEEFIEIMNLVKIMGVLSLSFAFPEIKLQQLDSPHKLKTYLNRNQIDPNNKFSMINKYVKQEVLKGTPFITIMNDILVKFSPKYNGWKRDFRHVLLEDSTYSKIKSIYPTMFENLNNVSIINPKTGEEKSLVDPEMAFDLVHAGSMSDFPDKMISYDEFLRVIAEDVGSLFIYGVYSRKDNGNVEYAISFKSLSKETNFKTIDIDEPKLHTIITELDALNGVAAIPLAYDFHREKLLHLVKDLERNVYIYFDIPYAYSRMFLKEMLIKEKSYPAFYMKYPNFFVLVIQINKSHIFLLPIVSLSTISLQNDLDNNLFKLHFNSSQEDLEQRVNQDAVRVIDSIVNASLNASLIKERIATEK